MRRSGKGITDREEHTQGTERHTRAQTVRRGMAGEETGKVLEGTLAFATSKERYLQNANVMSGQAP